MKIVYISNLPQLRGAGPNNSVPLQIKAQAKYDDVLWINLTDTYMDHWAENPYYNPKSVFKNFRLKSLPEPFNKPDLVIFECFYYPINCYIAFKLVSRKVPYIIIPRGELTTGAQSNKKIKKKTANILLFNSFARKAAAIQYLSKQEMLDSGDKWNENAFIIQNGVMEKENTIRI
jgi:hypothetical protein